MLLAFVQFPFFHFSPPQIHLSLEHTPAALLLILSFVWHRRELEHDKIFIFIVDIHIHNKYPENISLLTNSIFILFSLAILIKELFMREELWEIVSIMKIIIKNQTIFHISCLKNENKRDKSVPCAICFHLTKIIFVSLETNKFSLVVKFFEF